MKSSVALAAACGLAVVLALTGPARAQTGGTTGTTTSSAFADGDFFISVQSPEGANLSNFDIQRFFNQAACQCAEPVYIYVALTSQGFSKRGLVPAGTLRVLVGSNCNQTFYQPGCFQLYSDQTATFMANGRTTIKTDARIMSSEQVISATDGGILSGGTTPFAETDCSSSSGLPTGFNQTIWVTVDNGSDGSIDYSTSSTVQVDLTPPPAPTNIDVKSGNEAVVVSWDAVDVTVNTDLQGYQVLCRRGADLQVFANGTFGPYYKTCAMPVPGVVSVPATDDGVTGLNPLFACSPLLAATTTSYRVKILQNGITYAAAVVAVDNSGNAANPVLIDYRTPGNADALSNFAVPAPTESFYQEYRKGSPVNGGGAAAGGFCAVGPAPARGPWIAGGGVAALAALAWTRRRRRR